MRGIGKIDTTTLLLIGAAVVAIYFVTKKPATALPAPSQVYYPPGYNPYGTAANTGNSTSSIITAAGNVASSLLDKIDF